MNDAQPSADLLDRMRAVGDPDADATVAWLYANDQVDLANKILSGLYWDGAAPPEGFPVPLRAFLDRARQLPDWADHAKIERGQRLFMRHGILALTGLLTASLPSCYLMSKAVRVLGVTQQLVFHPYQRVIATAQMVVNTMTPGGMDPGAEGLKAALRVRLLHASIRYLTVEVAHRRAHAEIKAPLFEAIKHFHWTPANGTPINQEDSAYTLLTFSIVILEALQKLGARVSRDDQIAYLHLWSVIGAVMGVTQELLVETPEQAAALRDQILARQIGRTAEGVLLTRSLTHAIGKGVRSAAIANLLVPPVTRLMVGDAHADLLSVPQPSLAGRISKDIIVGSLHVAELLEALVSWIPFLATISGRAGKWMVDSLAAMPASWDESLFALPDDLRDARKPMTAT